VAYYHQTVSDGNTMARVAITGTVVSLRLCPRESYATQGIAISKAVVKIALYITEDSVSGIAVTDASNVLSVS
jgi:hypothetical protein